MSAFLFPSGFVCAGGRKIWEDMLGPGTRRVDRWVQSREQRRPSVGIFTNFAFFSSIFQACFAGRVLAPGSSSNTPRTTSFIFCPFRSQIPLISGELFEWEGKRSTSRIKEFNSKITYSLPQRLQ